jgi:hypothetical protein
LLGRCRRVTGAKRRHLTRPSPSMTAMGGEDDALARSARLASSVPCSAFRPEGASSVAGPGVRAVSRLASWPTPSRRTQGPGQERQEGRGRRQGNGKGEDVAKKVAELEPKVEELIGKGRIRPRPPPRSNRPSPSWPRPCSSQVEGWLPVATRDHPHVTEGAKRLTAPYRLPMRRYQSG